jgi:hypothetical protein
MKYQFIIIFYYYYYISILVYYNITDYIIRYYNAPSLLENFRVRKFYTAYVRLPLGLLTNRPLEVPFLP